jgi:predicted phosphodiesterase
MRIAIVSDIHGNLPALEAVVRDFGRRGVDAVVNLGDSLSGPLLPLETAQFLMVAQRWVHLAGNHERQILEIATSRPGNASDEYARSQLTPKELAWIASLTPSAAFDRHVFLCHGTPASDVEGFLETVKPGGIRIASRSEVDSRARGVDASLILCGHTHVPRVARSSKGQLVVNPGSVGLPAYDAHHPYPYVVENGSPDARYAIVERDGEGSAWTASLIAVPYDHAGVVAMARQRGREDWERALGTGYVR